MIRKIAGIVLLAASLSWGGSIEEDAKAFALVPMQKGGMSKDSYYDRLDIPDLYVGRKCYENCKKDCCYATLENEKGKILQSFSTSDSVGTIARTRYKDISYLYYSVTSGSGKNRKTTYYLADNTLKRYDIPNGIAGAFDIEISKDAQIIQVGRYGFYINGIHQLDQMDFEQGSIGTNLDGEIAVAGIDAVSDAVIVSNTQNWANSGMALAKRSDRENILATYPADNNHVYTVAYNLVNIYNKGLMGSYVDFGTKESKTGWLYNSEHVNIGFYPDIYGVDDNLYIKTQNSSVDSQVHFKLSQEKFQQIGMTSPNREGFEDEDMMEFMAGAGVSYLAWEASSKVEKDEDTYASADYEIANTLYKEVYLQGRIGDTQLAVSYAQNEAEKQGGLTKKASKVLSAFVDFNALISDSSSLRIGYTKAEVNGITTFKDEHFGAISVTPDGEKKEFTTTLQRVSLLVMQEKGYYWGGEYTSFETPATVGFSGSSKNIEYYGLDSKMGIQNIEVVLGYDTAAYAKRYETNYSSLYFQGLIGIGASIYDLSSDFKNRVETTSGKSINSSTYSMVVDAELEMGYIWQQRFKSARGLGYSIELGAKARGIYTGIGQSEESDSSIEADELEMEMSRYDIWYGPYLNVNLVF